MAENMTEMTKEQEQEQQALSEIREAAQQNIRPMNPGLVGWLASRPQLFASNVRGDLMNSPERHPDVILLKRLLPQSSLDLHVRMAWLCWRARQVRFFHPGAGARTHVGSDVLTWGEALESANTRDAVHDEAFEARANYYAARKPLDRADRERQREAEEANVANQLGRSLHTDPSVGTTSNTDYVPVNPVTVGDGVAQRAANTHAQKDAERKEEAEMARLRGDGVRVRKARK